MIILQRWYGRLGNNIIQLSNILDIAILYKHNILFYKMKSTFFDLDIISKYFSKFDNETILRNKYGFFYKNRNPYSKEISELTDKEKEKLLQEKSKILKDAFKIKDVDKLDENHLVIYIRSGDIFTRNPHSYYIPPPLSYYTKYIDKGKYEKIIIVSEDNNNPVVNKLLELYDNSIWEINKLEKDIKILLGATNIIQSVGTMVPSLMLLSDNIKIYYTTDDENLEEYYKVMKPWKFTNEQKEFMMIYKL